MRKIAVITFGVVALNFLLTVVFRKYYIDEPWLSEYAYWLAHTGKVKSQLFSSLPGYEDQIFVYHKFFTLVSAAVIELAGFGIWQLRGINLLFLLILLFFLYRLGQEMHPDKSWVLILLGLFLINPLIINFGNIYRPEIMVTCFGVMSYFFLRKALLERHSVSLYVSGFMAGLAAFTHLNGLIFLVAGAVLLIAEKRGKSFLIFSTVGGIVFLLYFWDVLFYGQWDMFLYQFQNDPAIAEKNTVWYSPFLNLLAEHQRWFRDTNLVVLHTILASLIILAWRYLKRAHSSLLIYTLALYLALGLLSPIKTTKYMIYVLPFVCIILTGGLRDIYYCRSLPLKKAVLVLGMLYIATGIVSSWELYSDNRFMVKNAQLSHELKERTSVIAPLSFIFGRIGQHNIYGLHYYKTFYNQYLGRRQPESYKNVFIDGYRKGVEYILINKKDLFPLEIIHKIQPNYAIIHEDTTWIVYQRRVLAVSN